MESTVQRSVMIVPSACFDVGHRSRRKDRRREAWRPIHTGAPPAQVGTPGNVFPRPPAHAGTPGNAFPRPPDEAGTPGNAFPRPPGYAGTPGNALPRPPAQAGTLPD